MLRAYVDGSFKEELQRVIECTLEGFVYHTIWHPCFGASLKDILLDFSTTKSYTSLEYLIYFYINGTINHTPVQFSLFALADKKLRAK